MAAVPHVSLQVVFLGQWDCRRAVVERAWDSRSLRIVSVFVSLHVSALGHAFPAGTALVWFLTLPLIATAPLVRQRCRAITFAAGWPSQVPTKSWGFLNAPLLYGETGVLTLFP